jgi:hypothetical protein
MNIDQELWTFERFHDRIKHDCAMEEEDPENEFVTMDGMVGFLNSAIDEAEADIHDLHEDYFLTSDYVALEEGETDYDMPENIFGNKIRDVIYSNGTQIYEVTRVAPSRQFLKIALERARGSSSGEYQYFLKNDGPRRRKFVLTRPASETAVLPPLPDDFTPMERWFLRQANRVPLTGVYCNPEDILPDAVDAATDEIEVDPEVTYVTGDRVKLEARAGGALPGGLTENTVYYVIAVDDNTIKLATSSANAQAETAIDLTSQGTGYFRLRVAATTTIINATVIDLPEYVNFLIHRVKQWVWEKDGDPRAKTAEVDAEKYKAQGQATLKNMVPDGRSDLVGIDKSSHEEMA